MINIDSENHKLSQMFSHVLNDRIIRPIKGRSRVLPDFIIFGTVRSGTTSLYYNICEHPCIEPADIDEIGFFDSNYKFGVNWYKSHFPTINKKNIILEKEKYFLTGEDTPFYFWSKDSTNRIFGLIPKIKLIAILRNPVDKAYSTFQLGVRSGNEKKSFEIAIKEEIKLIEEKKKSFDNPLSYSGIRVNLIQGMYVEQLKFWFEKFPRNQILVLSTEDLSNEPNTVLKNVFEFLNVPDKKITNLQKRKVAKYPKMESKTREFLLKFFKPHNEKLFKLVGKKFGWDN